jgi:3-hydroxyisobutyrate dehydrogenase
MPVIGIAGSGAVARLFESRLSQAGFSVAQIGSSETSADAAGGIRTLLVAPRDILEVEEMLFEGLALVRSLPALDTIVIAATLHPRFVRALRGRIEDDIALVDAPWSGTLRAAEEGQISFVLGGEAAVIARLQPLFAALGQRAARMGEFGTGMAAKVLRDHLAAASGAMTRLALDWAEAQGIDEACLLEASGAVLAAVPQPGFDVDLGDGAGEDRISDLLRGVEASIDTALTRAHLTPPRRGRPMPPPIRPRPLH